MHRVIYMCLTIMDTKIKSVYDITTAGYYK